MAGATRKVKCHTCGQRVPKETTKLERRRIPVGVRHNAKESHYYATVRCCLECP